MNWSVARRPVWLLGHVVALVAIVVFVRLGFWQLDRLDERIARNETVEAAGDLEVLDIDERLDRAPAEFRLVRVTGSFAAGSDILIRNRSLDGVAGFHVLTPLDLGDGTSVLIRRGFVAAGAVDDGQVIGDGPSGSYTVLGRVRAPESAARLTGFGWQPPPDGAAAVGGWVDVARIDAEIDAALDFAPEARFVDLIELDPPIESPVRALPAPDLGRGPHLSYAVQWFLFATVVLVGYPLVLRRAGADRRARPDTPDPDGSDPTARPEPTSGQANDSARQTSPTR